MAELILKVDDDKITNFVDLLEAAVTAAKLLPEYKPQAERKADTGEKKSWPKKEWKDEPTELPVTLEAASGGNNASTAQCGAAYGILKGYGLAGKDQQVEVFKVACNGQVQSAYELDKFSKASVSKLISGLKQNEKILKGDF